mmetsp:Transcript_1167/g.2734  ORF Transcript_1167/g.2734 Transcript_1167/m.2734 type:complete len:207 (-) Transcript_1167:198-818(-)|eukprot:CAMPEP_0206238840 /NCGR_PEP_ID=MMETSP0047_2-20121206/15041_1 /ASSEMBLY_ACC=CAM_ASM_000192 /TAXON_ID=195065 /ORGANISM="Chroomonas mesostigmatica_cf, Strain CCMP1168" /LENGTH=206 /DNA_ID=CAMNT_0053663425 /DNA_START=52 /DNA_END=672 /DNA_ORIENTATION=+
MLGVFCGLLVPAFLCLLGLYSVGVLLPGDPLMACHNEAWSGLNLTALPCPCSTLVPVPAAATWLHDIEPPCNSYIIMALGGTIIVLTLTQLVTRHMEKAAANDAQKALGFAPGEIPNSYWTSGGSRVESPQGRGTFWMKTIMFSVLGVALWGLSGFLFWERRWNEGGFAVVTSLPSLALGFDAWLALKRIDEQGFLPIRFIPSQFD